MVEAHSGVLHTLVIALVVHVVNGVRTILVMLDMGCVEPMLRVLLLAFHVAARQYLYESDLYGPFLGTLM